MLNEMKKRDRSALSAWKRRARRRALAIESLPVSQVRTGRSPAGMVLFAGDSGILRATIASPVEIHLSFLPLHLWQQNTAHVGSGTGFPRVKISGMFEVISKIFTMPPYTIPQTATVLFHRWLRIYCSKQSGNSLCRDKPRYHLKVKPPRCCNRRCQSSA